MGAPVKSSNEKTPPEKFRSSKARYIDVTTVYAQQIVKGLPCSVVTLELKNKRTRATTITLNEIS